MQNGHVPFPKVKWKGEWPVGAWTINHGVAGSLNDMEQDDQGVEHHAHDQ